jgi:signal transduction histidine kinase
MFFGLSERPLRRLNVRLALWHSVLSVTLVLGVLVLAYFALRGRVREQDRDVVVFRLSQFTAEYSQRGLDGVIKLAAWRKGRAQRAFFVRIATAENQTLFVRDADDWAEFAPEKLEHEQVPWPEAGAAHPSLQWTELWSDGVEVIIAGNRLPDGAIVQVGKATDETAALLRQFRTVSLAVLAVVIPLSFLGGALLSERALRPLRALTRTLREIQETARFSARTPESGVGDELDDLARIFNAAMERIELLLRTMRESLDNVAHDLRTPMTRLRNRAEACLEPSTEPSSAREALGECVEESDRVLQMLDTLMDIAEAEAGLVKPGAERVEVAELVRDGIDLYQEVAEEKGVTVRTEVPPSLEVKGDALLLRRVVANLLDNAIKYTSEGGTATWSATMHDGKVSIRLSDSGTGISPEDLPKLWERLFRADRSRCQRGLGLGLSFVKAIVEAHGGSVFAESTVGVGSTFGFTLPKA